MHETRKPTGEQNQPDATPHGGAEHDTTTGSGNALGFPFRDAALPLEERLEDLMTRLTTEQKVAQMGYQAPAIPELGIPAYNWWNEALHGIARSGLATVFPQAIALAATFDAPFVRRVAAAVTMEGRAKFNAVFDRWGSSGQYQGLSYWTPNINIFRDPRWGRGQETWGEDPHLTGTLGGAYAAGLQYGPEQADDESRRAEMLDADERGPYLWGAACAKHYAVHSGPEALRHEFDARVSERDLWETYLPAFEALVDGGVEAVMGAYNRVNGQPACGSPRLLDEILRGTWGFTGHVVSDCWAVRDFHTFHQVTKDVVESAAMAIESGCDLNCGDTYPAAVEAIRRGVLSEEAVDRAARRVFRTRFKLGLLDPPEERPFRHVTTASVNWDAHHDLAGEAAARSFVLVKNDGDILPIAADARSIYVTGPLATDVDSLMGNYYGSGTRYVSILEGIARRAGHEVQVEYRPGCLTDRYNPNGAMWAAREASGADVTVAVMGQDPRTEGEEGDAIASPSKGDRERVELPEHQVAYLRELKRRGARTVLVLMGGSAVAPADVEPFVDAILVAWYPGQAGGEAVARMLFGDVAPSGRLPVSFPRSTAELPAFDDYRMEGRTYRYGGAALYPFGFGRTYGTVTYGEVGVVGLASAPGSAVSPTDSSTVTSSGTTASRSAASHAEAVRKAELHVKIPEEVASFRGGAARAGGGAPQQVIRLVVTLRNAAERELREVVQIYRAFSDRPEQWSLAAFQSVVVSAGETTEARVDVPIRSLLRVDEDGAATLPLNETVTLCVARHAPGYVVDGVDAQIAVLPLSFAPEHG